MDNTLDGTFESANRVYDDEGLCPTIPTCGGGGIQPKVIKKTNGFYDQAIQTAIDGKAEIGDTIDAFNGKVNKSGVSPTLTTRPEGKKTAVLPVTEDYRIRKLTPRECFRLMGVTDEDADKMLAVNSNSQCYKIAGNAIVVDCLCALFRQLNIKGVPKWNKN